MEPGLLILDVDGVMTDGTKIYDETGRAIAKSFCDLDFTAIKLFWARGWKVCFLTSDNFNRGLARDRDIDFYCSRKPDGTIDKLSFLSVLADHYDVDYENIVYIGDDVMDLDIMQGLVDRGGQVYCPLNSAPYITRKFDIISCLGGHGVVMNLYDLFYEDNCDLREFCY